MMGNRQRYTKNKNSLFLMELISVIFFFSILSAICVQIFTKAHLTSKQSEVLDFAMNQAQNAAECIKQSDGAVSVLSRYFKGEALSDGMFRAYYDAEFAPLASSSSAAYYLEVSVELEERNLLYAEVAFCGMDAEEALFHLDVKKYLGSGGA